MNKNLKKTLMAGVLASALVGMPMTTQAGDWMGVVLPIGGLAFTLATTGTVAVMQGINTDAAQIAAEALVYAAMQTVTDNWEPEPKESYQKAAKKNDDGGSPGAGSAPVEQPMSFATQSLVAKGIESVPLANNPSLLSGAEARGQTQRQLTYLEGTGSDLHFGHFTSTQEDDIRARQIRNEQWISTEGIARAELALQTAQQGAVNDGASLSDSSSTLNTTGAGTILETSIGRNSKQQSLAGLVGTGSSSAYAMRIQSVMNLELAQRMNLTNMLQGNILSVESAHILQKSNPE